MLIAGAAGSGRTCAAVCIVASAVVARRPVLVIVPDSARGAAFERRLVAAMRVRPNAARNGILRLDGDKGDPMQLTRLRLASCRHAAAALECRMDGQGAGQGAQKANGTFTVQTFEKTDGALAAWTPQHQAAAAAAERAKGMAERWQQRQHGGSAQLALAQLRQTIHAARVACSAAVREAVVQESAAALAAISTQPALAEAAAILQGGGAAATNANGRAGAWGGRFWSCDGAARLMRQLWPVLIARPADAALWLGSAAAVRFGTVVLDSAEQLPLHVSAMAAARSETGGVVVVGNDGGFMLGSTAASSRRQSQRQTQRQSRHARGAAAAVSACRVVRLRGRFSNRAAVGSARSAKAGAASGQLRSPRRLFALPRRVMAALSGDAGALVVLGEDSFAFTRGVAARGAAAASAQRLDAQRFAMPPMPPSLRAAAAPQPRSARASPRKWRSKRLGNNLEVRRAVPSRPAA